MANSKKDPNCRVVHFGDKWWSTTMYVDIDQLRLCYPNDESGPEPKRWFHVIERLLGMPKQLYLESGVQQTMARKLLTDKVQSSLQARHGDFLDRFPFDFADLVFVFDSSVQDSEERLRFSKRVLA